MCKQTRLTGALPISWRVTHSVVSGPAAGLPSAAPAPLLFISLGEALFSLPSNEVSLYDCGAHHNQSYTGGVNRTETNAAVTRHRTLPVYGLIIHQRLH